MPLPLCPRIIGEQLEVFSEGGKSMTLRPSAYQPPYSPSQALLCLILSSV